MLKLYSTFDQSNFTLQQPGPDEGTDIDYHLKNGNYFTDVSWNTMLTKKLGMNTAASFTWNRDNIFYGQTTVKKQTTGVFMKDVFTFSFTNEIMLKSGGEWQSRSFRETAWLPEEDHDNQFTSNIVCCNSSRLITFLYTGLLYHAFRKNGR